VSTNRLVKYWDSAEDLPALVSLNLNKTISEYPAIGWVRANKVASEELLTEINELRKENSNLHQTNEDLQEELAQFNSQPVVENLAGLDEKVKLFGTYTSSYQHQRSSWEITLTWSQIFTFIAPYLPSSPRDRHVKEILEEAAFKMRDIKGYSPDLDDQLFRTIALQLQVLNLVQIKHTHVPAGGTGYWSLTPYGTRLMIQLRTVKKPASDNKDIK
jgi:hypothetical protein